MAELNRNLFPKNMLGDPSSIDFDIASPAFGDPTSISEKQMFSELDDINQ